MSSSWKDASVGVSVGLAFRGLLLRVALNELRIPLLHVFSCFRDSLLQSRIICRGIKAPKHKKGRLRLTISLDFYKTGIGKRPIENQQCHVDILRTEIPSCK